MYIVPAIKYEHGIFQEVQDNLTVEEILSISINGSPYTMTMRTPGNEEELTRGILLSEEVYEDYENPDFEILEINDKNYITKVNVNIPENKIGKGINTKRNLLSVTSCGMCGKQETTLTLIGDKIVSKKEISSQNILDFFQKMQHLQKGFKQTGGSHASAIFDYEGNILSIMEDIGRHNAVDKVIGSLLLKNKLQDAACITVSGRISYEIVNKCFKAKIPYLAAVSAPSSMAVEFCEEKGIKLFAFCRKEKYTQYC